MKKGLLSIFCLLALMVTAVPASAQTRFRRSSDDRRYEQRVTDWRYRNDRTSGRRYSGPLGTEIFLGSAPRQADHGNRRRSRRGGRRSGWW